MRLRCRQDWLRMSLAGRGPRSGVLGRPLQRGAEDDVGHQVETRQHVWWSMSWKPYVKGSRADGIAVSFTGAVGGEGWGFGVGRRWTKLRKIRSWMYRRRIYNENHFSQQCLRSARWRTFATLQNQHFQNFRIIRFITSKQNFGELSGFCKLWWIYRWNFIALC